MGLPLVFLGGRAWEWGFRRCVNAASFVKLDTFFYLSFELATFPSFEGKTTAELQQRLGGPKGTSSRDFRTMNLYPLQQIALGPQQKAPKRITITVPFAILDQLVERSGYEGRSLSNLAAFLLEQGLSTKR